MESDSHVLEMAWMTRFSFNQYLSDVGGLT